MIATRNKCHATRNRCLTSSNNKLVETSATLLGTGALLVVTMIATRNKCHATRNRCLTSSNNKLVETSATLLGTGALLVVTMIATRNKCLTTVGLASLNYPASYWHHGAPAEGWHMQEEASVTTPFFSKLFHSPPLFLLGLLSASEVPKEAPLPQKWKAEGMAHRNGYRGVINDLP